MRKRILFVQYAGNYERAYQSLQEGGEYYYGHAHVLGVLAELAEDSEAVGMLCANSDVLHDVVLPTNVRVMGLGRVRRWEWSKVIAAIAAFAPTHIVVLGPFTRVLRWGLKNDVSLLPVFADSFEMNPLRRLVRFGRLASVLSDDRIGFVANHGIGACLSLARLGVGRKKIVPWDWPQRRTPAETKIKQSAAESDSSIFYAGLVSESKGVGDLVRAVSVLARMGVSIKLKIAGGGDTDRFAALAKQLGVESAVEFLGLIKNDQVVRNMRSATIVAVPSHHSYPEGFPLTIYEALCTHTPIVASDHPMFVRRLHHRQNALIFKAGDANQLAGCVRDLLLDPELYRKISSSADETWQGLQIPLKWGDLIKDWAASGSSERIRSNTMSSGRYSLEQ